MHFEGTLRQWNEERGFGFIETVETGERLFVHLSAFERGRIRPPLGARLVFEVRHDEQGRKRAVNVRMPGDRFVRAEGRARPAGSGPARRSPPRTAWIVIALLCAVVAVVGVRGVRRETASFELPPGAKAASLRDAGDGGPAPAYRCDGRTACSQMTSCAEATWFLQHCAGVTMDGNHDGVPCERQWCAAR